MNSNKENFQVIDPPKKPTPLTVIKPKGSIRMVFWGLRIYIVVMVVLVVIGFLHGVH